MDWLFYILIAVAILAYGFGIYFLTADQYIANRWEFTEVAGHLLWPLTLILVVVWAIYDWLRSWLRRTFARG